MSTTEKTVLAIDPGSSKLGMAVVRRTTENRLDILWRVICREKDFDQALDDAKAAAEFSMIICGSGTTSKQLVTRLREAMPSIGILTVDEANTSLQARERYWEENPRRGWRRLLPATMQTPPEEVDDFVAVILAERVLLAD